MTRARRMLGQPRRARCASGLSDFASSVPPQATLGDFASERADAHDSLSAIAGQVRLGLPALRQSPS